MRWVKTFQYAGLRRTLSPARPTGVTSRVAAERELVTLNPDYSRRLRMTVNQPPQGSSSA
jgi:hypothetical protein